jgi:hypothetical protein
MKTKFTLVLPESYRVSQSQAEPLLQSLTIQSNDYLIHFFQMIKYDFLILSCRKLQTCHGVFTEYHYTIIDNKMLSENNAK